MNWHRAVVLSAVVLIPGLVSASTPQFKAGDRVEADVMMAGSPERAVWRKATIISVSMWNGQVSAYRVKPDDAAELMISGAYLRALAKAEPQNEVKPQPAPAPRKAAPVPASLSKPAQQKGQFKAGDRVEVDSIMAREPKDSRWRKATVTLFDPANRRYVVRLDDNFLEMSVLFSPDKIWIRPLNDGSSAPKQRDCASNVPAGKVTDGAPASAELFKRVIYDYSDSIKRGSKLGIKFETFKLGKSYRNVVTAKGLLIDFAPENVTIHPVKTRTLVCEQHTTLVNRVVSEMEYACHKDEFDEWVCRVSSSRQVERTSIYPE